MEFRILGSMEVIDGFRHVDLPAGRGRSLLALLILHAGEALSADGLIDELWGEHPPATASTVVQGLVSKLRRELEPGRVKGDTPTILQTAGAGYRLAVDAQTVDAHRFSGMVEQARGAPAEARSRILGEALRLWRGAALADFAYEPFAQRAITTLEELRLAAIEDRLDADLALGRGGDLVAEIEQQVMAHPLRERLRGQLMVALYRAGRQADALEAYRRARQILIDELGIEPSRALRDLEGAILRQDPSLDPPPGIEGAQHESEAATRAAHWLPRERRSVTVVFADLALPSDPGVDAELSARVAQQAVDMGAAILRRHGARVEEVAGGQLLGWFGLPVAHEDDAFRAVRAAVELRTAADDLRLSARVGIDTGEVVTRLMRNPAGGGVSGPVVAAARLREAAAGGEIVVGAQTQQLIRGAVVVEGVDERVWRVLGIVSGAGALPRHLESPMYGRQSELSRLRAFYGQTARSGNASWLTVVGEAGMGKTRLAKEFVESIAPAALVMTGRCPPYGEGITFLPLREALLEAAGPRGWPALVELLESEKDGGQAASQVAAAIGLVPHQGSPLPLFPAIRRIFEILAAKQPLIVVFEDLHWAEPTLVELIGYLAGHANGPICMVGLTRPELLEDHSGLLIGSAETLVLEPLSATDVADLVADRSAAAVDREDIDRIVSTAQGNPLFAEQLLAAFSEHSVDMVPATLQSLLAMRLDQLGPGERDLLRCAAVIGTDWHLPALAALLPDDAHTFIRRHLDTLERKRLIERTGATAFRFGHVLIQFAAYRSMTREDRARLHERFADWLEAADSGPPELDEIAGYHLEQAVEHRRDSGAVDETMQALASRAGHRLADAAERAQARFDMTAAENLLTRARAMLAAEDPRRLVVTQRLAETDLVLGRHHQGQALLEELIDHARAAGDASDERRARLEWARIQFVTGPDPVPLAELRREADEATAFYTGAGDDAGLSQATFLLGSVHLRQGTPVAAARAFGEGIVLADRSRLVREEMAHRWMLAQSVALGPTPVPECLDLCRQRSTVRGLVHPGVLTEMAILLAMQGHIDEALEMNERARQIFVERFHVRRMLRFVAQANGTINLMAGRYAQAEREFRVAVESTSEMGEREPLALAAAGLASALRAQKNVEEADAYAALSSQAAPSEAAAAQALSLMGAAHAASHADDTHQALRLAREAVRRAPKEMLNLRAGMHAELAELLRWAGQPEAATRAGEEAVRLYRRKGNTAST